MELDLTEEQLEDIRAEAREELARKAGKARQAQMTPEERKAYSVMLNKAKAQKKLDKDQAGMVS